MDSPFCPDKASLDKAVNPQQLVSARYEESFDWGLALFALYFSSLLAILSWAPLLPAGSLARSLLIYGAIVPFTMGSGFFAHGVAGWIDEELRIQRPFGLRDFPGETFMDITAHGRGLAFPPGISIAELAARSSVATDTISHYRNSNRLLQLSKATVSIDPKNLDPFVISVGTAKFQINTKLPIQDKAGLALVAGLFTTKSAPRGVLYVRDAELRVRLAARVASVIGCKPEEIIRHDSVAIPYIVLNGIRNHFSSNKADEFSRLIQHLGVWPRAVRRSFLAGFLEMHSSVTSRGLALLHFDQDALELLRVLLKREGIGSTPVRSVRKNSSSFRTKINTESYPCFLDLLDSDGSVFLKAKKQFPSQILPDVDGESIQWLVSKLDEQSSKTTLQHTSKPGDPKTMETHADDARKLAEVIVAKTPLEFLYAETLVEKQILIVDKLSNDEFVATLTPQAQLAIMAGSGREKSPSDAPQHTGKTVRRRSRRTRSTKDKPSSSEQDTIADPRLRIIAGQIRDLTERQIKHADELNNSLNQVEELETRLESMGARRDQLENANSGLLTQIAERKRDLRQANNESTQRDKQMRRLEQDLEKATKRLTHVDQMKLQLEYEKKRAEAESKQRAQLQILAARLVWFLRERLNLNQSQANLLQRLAERSTADSGMIEAWMGVKGLEALESLVESGYIRKVRGPLSLKKNRYKLNITALSTKLDDMSP